MGEIATEYAQKLFSANEYTNYLYYQGSRYSFGYPACPNMQDQYVQLDLLDSKRIGMYMDESEQIYPEQSTSEIVCYHPVANYFSA